MQKGGTRERDRERERVRARAGDVLGDSRQSEELEAECLISNVNACVQCQRPRQGGACFGTNALVGALSTEDGSIFALCANGRGKLPGERRTKILQQ